MNSLKKIRIYLFPLLFLVLGLGVSLFQFYGRYSFYQKPQEKKTKLLAKKVLATSLIDQINLHFASLKTIRTFFNSSEEVTKHEFNLFSNELLNQHKLEGVKFIGWAERTNFSQTTEEPVSTVKKNRNLVILKYIAPSREYRQLSGINLTKNQYLKSLMEKSVLENRLLISRPGQKKFFILDSDQEVAAILPVFDRKSDKEELFSGHFRVIRGFIVAALDLEVIFKKAIAGLDEGIFEDAKFEFWDITDSSAVVPLTSGLKNQPQTFSQLLTGWQNGRGGFAAVNHFSAGSRNFLFLIIFSDNKIFHYPFYYYLDIAVLAILFVSFSIIFYTLIRKQRKNNQELKESKRSNEDVKFKFKKLKNSQESFASTVSHELKTPLTAIGTALEILKREGLERLNESQKNYFQKAVNNTKRLSRLIGSVLNVSQIESGKKTLNIKSTNINNIIRDVVDIEKFSAQKKDLELIVQLEDGLPAAEVDIEGVDQVLTNLIENAIKFTEKGKIFVISKSNPEKNYIEVVIRDTGEGIEHKDYLNVFDRFKQLQKPEDVKTGGVGLGLSICKRIISLHNGIIWVDSEKTKGSSFIFRVPIRLKKGLINGSVAKPVLIVEDEKDLVEMIQHQLENEGYNVVVAYDGVQALEKIKEIEPGLILLDINLPKMSGLEFYSKICTAHGRAPYPVIVMTARSSLEKTFEDIEVDGFLAKPFEIDDLINKVNHIFRKPDPIVYLISDSDSKHVKNIYQVLKKERFEVVKIKGLKELRLNLQIKQPDFIILEYGFAAKSGEEMIEAIINYLERMKKENAKKTPIIVYSYLGFKDYRQKSIDAGADIYIEKPTDYDQFVTALRKLKS